MARLVAVVCVVTALVAGVGLGSAATARSIAIVKATPGSNGVVTITVRITGWTMLPGRVGRKPNSATGGHWHIYVDGKYNGVSANARTGKTRPLKQGSHVIRVELANNDHSSLGPRVRSRGVTVKVVPPTPPPDDPPTETEPPPYGY